jgi:hypothetical protein
MPYLGIAKQRLAEQLGSPATKGEGRQNMLCASLAAARLLGLLGNALVGAWWLDPVVGLLIAALAVKEGREAWRGEGCCVAPLEGAAPDQSVGRITGLDQLGCGCARLVVVWVVHRQVELAQVEQARLGTGGRPLERSLQRRPTRR